MNLPPRQSGMDRDRSVAASHALADLRRVSAQAARLKVKQDRLIDACIGLGLSERRIGAAAGMSGPAIHYRKKERAA